MNKKTKLLQTLARLDSFQEMQSRLQYLEAFADFELKDRQLQASYEAQARSFKAPIEWGELADEFRSLSQLVIEQQRQRTSISLSRVEHEKLALLENQKEKKMKEKAVERFKEREKKEIEHRESMMDEEFATRWFLKQSKK